MPDYSNTHIYKIVCKDKTITDCYVGHTTNLKLRQTNHRDKCNPNHCKSGIKLYMFIREHGGWSNWEIQIIDHYPTCENKSQATIREQEWIEKINPTLNDRKATATAEELREQKNAWKRQSERHHEYAREYSKNISREKKDEKNAKQRARFAAMTAEERSEHWKQYKKPKSQAESIN